MTQFLYKIGLYVAGVSLLIVINSSIIKEIFSGISSLASALKGAVNAVPNAINTAARTKQSWDTLKGGSGGSGGKSGGNSLGSGGAGVKAGGGDKLTAAMAGGAAGAAAAAAIRSGSAGPMFQPLNSAMPSPSSASPGIKRGDGLAPAMPAPKMNNPHNFKTKGRDGADLNNMLKKTPELQKLDPVKTADRTKEENMADVEEIAKEAGEKEKTAALARGASQKEAENIAKEKKTEVSDAGSQIEEAYRKELKQSNAEKELVSGVDMNKLVSMNTHERASLASNITASKKEEAKKEFFDKKMNEYNSLPKRERPSKEVMERQANKYADKRTETYTKQTLPSVKGAVEKAYNRAVSSASYSNNMQSLETYNKSLEVSHGGYRFASGGEPGELKTYKKEGSGEAAFLPETKWTEQCKRVDRFSGATDAEIASAATLAKANFEDAATMFARNSNGARNYLDSYQGATDAEKYQNAVDAFSMAALYSVMPETKAVTIINNAENKIAANMVLQFGKDNLEDRSHFAIGMNLQNYTTENKNVTRGDRIPAVSAIMRANDMKKKF